jgi:hypothetical protein
MNKFKDFSTDQPLTFTSHKRAVEWACSALLTIRYIMKPTPPPPPAHRFNLLFSVVTKCLLVFIAPYLKELLHRLK